MVSFMFFSIPFSPQQINLFGIIILVDGEIRHSSKVMGCYTYTTVEMTSLSLSHAVESEDHFYYQ